MPTSIFHTYLVYMKMLGYNWSEISKATGRTPKSCQQVYFAHPNCVQLRKDIADSIKEQVTTLHISALLGTKFDKPDWATVIARAVGVKPSDALPLAQVPPRHPRRRTVDPESDPAPADSQSDVPDYQI